MADTIETASDAAERIAALEAMLAAERARVAAVTAERDRLRESYQRLQLELELMRRRLFVAKAERIDTAQLELEFAGKLAALDALQQQLGPIAGLPPPTPTDGPGAIPAPGPVKRTPTSKPTGRRDLRGLDLPEERVEIVDPELEGTAARIGVEESCKLMWRRAGFARLIIARVKYRVDQPASDASPLTSVATAPPPPELIPRARAAPSLLAHVISDKLCDGLPLHRQEDRFQRLGVPIDRDTMCRWLEEAGATLGATVVAAMHADALRTAFCIATDATGVLVQPIQGGDEPRRGCRRGHYFVQIADADHVFFEYTPRETSAAVGELFRGFAGYIQADAKSVYDSLFTPRSTRAQPLEGDGEPDLARRHEVGCWAHGRRKLWDAAVTTKDPVAREGLLRVQRIFDLERSWRGRPHAEIHALRARHLRPETDAFFAWIDDEYARVKDRRGLLRSALGYAHRQRGPLTRFFDDGRLQLTNNHSERELRRVAVGRKAWLFVGSDDHAQAAGNLLSLIASARLHRLDPEAYLRDVIRVLPHWPRDRYLELCPRDWRATRPRLDDAQLERELGPLTLSPPSSEQPTAR